MKLHKLLEILNTYPTLSSAIKEIAEDLDIKEATATRFIKTKLIITEKDSKRIYTHPSNNPEKDMFLTYWFGDDVRIPKPGTRTWDYPKDLFNEQDVISYFELVSEFDSSKLELLTPLYIKRLSKYIFHVLDHPMDALFITEKELSQGYLLTPNRKMPLVAGLINLFILHSFMKYKITLPLDISCVAFSNFSSYISSLRNDEQKKYIVTERLSIYSRILISNISNLNPLIDALDNELQHGNYNTLFYSNNLLYYVAAICMASGNYDIEKHTIKEWLPARIDYLLKTINNPDSKSTMYREKVSFNFFFEYKFSPLLSDISSYLEKFPKENEIYYVFGLYKIYLNLMKLSIKNFTYSKQLLNFLPKGVSKIEELQKDKILECVLGYIGYVKENNLTESTSKRAISGFLYILNDIKSIFEVQNMFNLSYTFSFEAEELKYNLGKVITRNKLKLNSKDELGLLPTTIYDIAIKELGNLETSDNEGTLKADILLADEVVRAIYNYKIKGEKGTWEYYLELQLTTMLRIMANGGTRSIEVKNMPYGTLSYLEEENINICILGTSKLGERFGVIPISSETADMIRECNNLRKQYPESYAPIHASGNPSRDSDSKYTMQFFFVSQMVKYKRKISQISDYRLREHLEKVCKEANVDLPQGKGFHLLRHRAAEYFFFCLSYYDNDHMDDYEYKEQVVKRLLRHNNAEMTKKYYWTKLTQLLAENKLVFKKSLPDLNKYLDQDSEIHRKSIIARINKDLNGDLSTYNIERIIKILTIPTNLINSEVIEKLSQQQSYKTILDSFRRVDGFKNYVPAGGAFFGMCLNRSCPLLKQNITCISGCTSHMIQDKDVDVAIAEIAKCQMKINYINKMSELEEADSDHRKSLRSRISTLIHRLHEELGLDELTIAQRLEQQLNSQLGG